MAAEKRPRGRPKGYPKSGGGSRKGVPNKSTTELKAMILAALDKVGGESYLSGQAITTPASFMALLGRIIPTQITGDKDNPLELVVRAKADLGTKLDRIAKSESA